MKRFGALALVVLLLFLTACRGTVEETPTPTPTPPPTPTATPEPTPEPTPPPWAGPRNPLTGEPVEADISQMRPWAVQINNLQRALPQVGLRYADIIYEMPVEGGITRILAVFQDVEGVGEIGPVRSARHYFLDIVQGHDAIFVHAGGSHQAYAAIRGRGVPNIDGVQGSGREFYRDQDRSRRAGFEHSLMTTDRLLLDNVDRLGFRREHEAGFSPNLRFCLEGVSEAGQAPAGGQVANEVSVRVSNVKTGGFTFDEETGLYSVSQFGGPHRDGTTGEQLEVANVLVLWASFRSIDGEGRLDVNLNLGGEGYFITGGHAVPILWTKGGYTAPFNFTHTDGRPLELTVGQTYVNIVNTNTGEVTFN